MSSANIDNLLRESGASIEFDANGYFLKIRFFPTVSFLEQTKASEPSSCTDSFYHPADESSRKGNIYTRVREGSGEPKIVEQSCRDLTGFSHCYSERVLSKVPPGMIKYVGYSFTRKELAIEGEEKMELYYDTVHEPLEYQIVTLRVKLSFDPTEPGVFEKLQKQLNDLNYPRYPVYTKLMIVLQCSCDYELYETLYRQFDPSRISVSHKIQEVFGDKSALLINRDYIWFVDNQIEQAQVMHDSGYEESECFARLKEMRPTGNEFIDCDDDDHF